MECEKCKSENVVQKPWDQVTRNDEMSFRASMVNNANNPPKTTHEAIVRLGLFYAGFAIKAIASTVYLCKNCGHKWRKWF